MKRTAEQVKKGLRKKLIRAALKAHNAKDAETRDATLEQVKKLAGCDKLPAGGMRDNCEKKKNEGGGKDEKSDDKGGNGKMPADLLDKFKKKKAGTSKVAIKKETEDFARWVFSTQPPMAPSEVQTFVERTLGIKTMPPRRKRTGPRYQRGDSVTINFSKHKDRNSDPGPYKRFNGKVGTVTEIDESDKSVLVAFKGEPAPVRFEGALKTRGVGIYKYTAPYTIKGSAKIEMIYEAGGASTKDAQLVVEAYVARGGGHKESRSGNYYTGYVVSGATGKNGYYFKAFPQQRITVDPQSEAGYLARSFNPAKGKVLYIGVFNSRPAKWQDELKALNKQAEATD